MISTTYSFTLTQLISGFDLFHRPNWWRSLILGRDEFVIYRFADLTVSLFGASYISNSFIYVFLGIAVPLGRELSYGSIFFFLKRRKVYPTCSGDLVDFHSSIYILVSIFVYAKIHGSVVTSSRGVVLFIICLT